MIICPFSYGKPTAHRIRHKRFGFPYVDRAIECSENASCALWDEEEHRCGIMSILNEMRKEKKHE